MDLLPIAGRAVDGTGLGTAQFAFRDGTPEESVATVHAALDAGVMLIDTALADTRAGVESYAEQVVARALAAGRPDAVRDRARSS
jgi:pyridoxine 4-dehydrogenase